MKKELIVHEDPKSPISEIFRTLRTNIQFMNTKGKLKTLLITSTLPGEGKSWVSSNLAVGFAQTGKRVILIDADMRKGRQYSIFGVSPRPGLSNYLSGVDANYNDKTSDDLVDYIQETEVENLYLIAAGNVPPNPSELLISSKMTELLEKLKEICDIIIIDGTPSQLVADSLVLTRLVDSTILVTASKQTKKDDLQRVIKNVQNVGGKIGGVVLNKMPVSSKKYQQSYYYGSTTLVPTKPQERNRKIVTDVDDSKTKNKQDIEKVKSNNNNLETRINLNNDFKKTKMKETEKQKRIIQGPKGQVAITKEQIIQEPIINEPIVQKQRKHENDENIILESKIKIDNAEEITLDKTNEILKQINEYLEQEKKKLQ